MENEKIYLNADQSKQKLVNKGPAQRPTATKVRASEQDKSKASKASKDSPDRPKRT